MADVDAQVRVMLEHLQVFAFLDPAGKKRGADQLKKVRANTAIAVIGVDALTRVWVLEAWRGKTSAEATKEKVFDLNAKWSPKVFGVEANAMQELYHEMLVMEAQRQKVRINLYPVTQPTTVDKHWRIRSVLNPIINHGRLILRPDQHDLIRELVSFPMSPLVDLVDALASACALIPARTQHASPEPSTADEAAELAAYLRDQGVRPDLIRERLAQLTGRRT